MTKQEFIKRVGEGYSDAYEDANLLYMALRCIEQYPQYPMLQVRYLEMLDNFTNEILPPSK